MLHLYRFRETIDDIKNCQLIYNCFSRLNNQLFLYIYIPKEIFMIIIDLYYIIRNRLIKIPVFDYKTIIDCDINFKFAQIPKKYLKTGRYGHITLFLNDIPNEYNFVVKEPENEEWESRDKVLCFYQNNSLCDNKNCILFLQGSYYWSRKMGEVLSLNSRNSFMINY